MVLFKFVSVLCISKKEIRISYSYEEKKRRIDGGRMEIRRREWGGNGSGGKSE